MNTSNLTENDLRTLAEQATKSPGTAPLVSVYLPIATTPQERRKNDIRLKNAIASLESELSRVMEDTADRDPLLSPLREWQSAGGPQPGDGPGLALFIDADQARAFTLQQEVDEHTIVADRFYLKPAIAALSARSRYWLLSLARDSVALYRGEGDRLQAVDLHDDVPRSIGDALGEELSEPQLQHHAGSAGSEEAIFHGHGAGKDREQEETRRFLKLLDTTLREHCLDGAPLLLAGVDELTAAFRSVSGYEPIFDVTVQGSPESLRPGELEEVASQAVRTAMRGQRIDELERLAAGSEGAGRATVDLEAIVTAAHDGRIERLYITGDRSCQGAYDPAKRTVRRLEAEAADAVDLLDLAAAKALATGAEVVALPSGRFPGDQPAAAILRYTTKRARQSSGERADP